ncbi:MAG: hypothetical protein IT578_02200 [Verrucomicrobiae bacterium]|nr:hypothetical protein [Verrucomicrobiae bacterium]
MKTSSFFTGIILGALIAGASLAKAEIRTETGQKQYMTQGELAKRVAFISGLADAIPNPVTGDAAARALEVKGWTPIEGWRTTAVATKEDFYVVMAKYLGLKAKNPDDPKSYLEALTLAGFSFGPSAGKGVPSALEDRDPSLSRLVLDVKDPAEYREGPGGAWAKLGKLQLVKEGMSFRTGNGGQIDVVYVKGAAQRIYGNSEVTVEMLRQDMVNNQPVRAVVVYIAKGEAVSIVDPMNKASQFVMRDPLGKFEVDRAAGCKFNARVADDQSITLNRREIRLANGWKVLVQVQPMSYFTVLAGLAQYFSAGGTPQVISPGQMAIITFQAQGQTVKITLTSTDATSLSNLAQAIQQVATLFNELPPSARENLLTPAELTSLLNRALGSSGQAVNLEVTPVK